MSVKYSNSKSNFHPKENFTFPLTLVPRSSELITITVLEDAITSIWKIIISPSAEARNVEQDYLIYNLIHDVLICSEKILDRISLNLKDIIDGMSIQLNIVLVATFIVLVAL